MLTVLLLQAFLAQMLILTHFGINGNFCVHCDSLNMYLLDVGLCVTPALDAGTLGAELVPALMVLLGTKRTLFPMGRKGQERRFVFQVRRDA